MDTETVFEHDDAATELLNDVHRAQLIAYLQACHLRLGFLINYNVALMRDGVQRILNPHYI
jgi:GxxExxY protein